jgi:hypothetical protein
MIRLPTSVDPVKATLSIPGCSTRSRPVSPAPVAASRTWDVFGEVREGAGFVTTVVIAASGERQ